MKTQNRKEMQSQIEDLKNLINSPLFKEANEKSVQTLLLDRLNSLENSLSDEIKLTSENFKMKYEEISDINMERHLEYLDDTTGNVDRYTDDDVCDDTHEEVWGFFKDLGYTNEEIDEVADNTIY